MWKMKVAGLLLLILGTPVGIFAYGNFLNARLENGDLSHPYTVLGWLLGTVLVTGFASSLIMKQESEGYFPLRVRTIGIALCVNAFLLATLFHSFDFKIAIDALAKNLPARRPDFYKGALFALFMVLVPLFSGFLFWILRWSAADDPGDQWRGWKLIVQFLGGLVFLGQLYCQILGPRWFADLLANSEGKGGLVDVMIFDILIVAMISLYVAAGYPLPKRKKKEGYTSVGQGTSPGG